MKKRTRKEEEKKKKEKKLKLVMHDEQVFKDGDEVYVWIYDPVPLKTFIIGLLLVLGAIGLCLFPLWPSEVRVGVYYLSLSGAVFVGFILFLIVLRFVLFCLVWLLTLGRHHFWFLPNLTEDVGFFDSFKPLYKHDKFDGTETKDKTTSGDDKKGSGVNEDKKGLGNEDGSEKKGGGEDKKGLENEEDQNGFELVDKSEVESDGGAGESIDLNSPENTEPKKTK